MHINSSLDTETEAGRYLVACAQIRNIDVATSGAPAYRRDR